MIDNILLYLDQNLTNLWILVAIIYILGFIATLGLSFTSALTLGYEPKGCSSCAVSLIMIPFMIIWPLFWLVVIVSFFIKAKNSE